MREFLLYILNFEFAVMAHFKEFLSEQKTMLLKKRDDFSQKEDKQFRENTHSRTPPPNMIDI